MQLVLDQEPHHVVRDGEQRVRHAGDGGPHLLQARWSRPARSATRCPGVALRTARGRRCPDGTAAGQSCSRWRCPRGPTAAIARATRLSGGELGAALGRARAGVPLADALRQVADRTSLDPLARFVDGLLVALERGTPLGEVLRAQAADVREAGKRRLLEAGGRKEIAR
jgi:hypothetical protein